MIKYYDVTSYKLKKMKQQVVCILNPFVSSKYLTETFKKNGILSISLLTDLENAREPRYNKANFLEEIILTGNISKDIKNLSETVFKKYNVLSLINGLEDTLDYGDLLANHLKLPYSNPPETSHLRYDKNQQIKVLHKNNISAPLNSYITQRDIKQLDNLIKTINFPVVIKPSKNGGSSIGVKICKNQNDLTTYFKERSKTNAFNHSFTEYCLQEYLIGKEIVIDTVSLNGEHYFTSCWLYEKRLLGNIPVYKTALCLPHTHSYSKVGFKYMQEVLNVIEYKNGLAHSEIMLTQEPKLIEVNPRVSGAFGYHNFDVIQCGGYIDQISKYSSLISVNNVNLSDKKDNCVATYFFYNFNKYSKEIFKAKMNKIKNIEHIYINNFIKNTSETNLANCYAYIRIITSSIEELNTTINKIENFEKGAQFNVI